MGDYSRAIEEHHEISDMMVCVEEINGYVDGFFRRFGFVSGAAIGDETDTLTSLQAKFLADNAMVIFYDEQVEWTE